ncbi:DUF4233 domain-containing protein [Ornithinimicrobium sp. INDO-MA30-4]|uniref:DUF4233 domain-containing protein n=1 Tax=Ornithinimicrobium sp. INDO-MA30-4 TaxID=2908651 RepID=UPI001F37E361|nr:DUF4233 domain-containing protein [Ornithinimicrobium sp. INDO-MA30-4]UJH70717.1 DUF4233 domain-containing protein [Ornithinimicrobium sp. INDO-MA30-4]
MPSRPFAPKVLFDRHPDKMTRRIAAASLIGQGIAIFLGGLTARQFAIADGDPNGLAQVYLWGGIGFAVACVLASGLLRKPYGLMVGWLIQLATFASALILPAMVWVGVIFGGLWWLSVVQGHRIDRIRVEWAAQAASEEENGN